MAKVQKHLHHSWFLIIVIPLVVAALGLVLILGLINKNQFKFADNNQPQQPTPTPTITESNQLDQIEKDLNLAEIDDLQKELEQMETLLNQF